IGLLASAGTEPTVKLYLQLRDTADRSAWEVTEKILGASLSAVREAGRPLHMVGMDLSSRGLARAKLYTVERRAALESEPFTRVPLLQDLVRSGVTTLDDVLVIHRMSGPVDDDLARPAEIDFGLARNELTWEALRELGALAPALDPAGALSRIER